MTIKNLLLAAPLALGASLLAAPLSGPTAVQLQPDASSPVILVLGAGTEQPAASRTAPPAPEGWLAVDLNGPFTAYVKNRDLTKQLDVSPGASVYLGPKEDSGILTTFAKGDKAEITGLRGSWTQIRLDKALVGYVASNQTTPAQAAGPAEKPAASALSAPTSPSSAPTAPAAPAAAEPKGTPAEAARLFEGKFVSSESFLYPHRPYPWELDDASGHRIAYVNLQGILLTDQVENYADHTVVILGTLRPARESRDLVIDVEAFHLR